MKTATSKTKTRTPGGAAPAEARLEQLPLKALVPHPDQGAYYATYDPQTYAALVKSIRAEGVREPVDVLPGGNAAGLPANTILAGHTRARAADEAGLKAVPAKVRYDLRGATRAKVDEVFHCSNTLKRQLSPLARARAAVALFRSREAAAGRAVYGSAFDNTKLRTEVAAILGMSGRNLNRYLNVLEAPVEVQQAVDAGRVKLVVAARVTLLPKAEQKRLADRLRAGEDPAAVLADAFPAARPGGRQVKPRDAVAAFARQLDKARADLADRLGQVVPGTVRRHRDALAAGKELVDGLLARLAGG